MEKGAKMRQGSSLAEGSVAVIEDTDYIELPDKRLTNRLKQIVEQLSAAPERSIPAGCGGWHESKAAYRFF